MLKYVCMERLCSDVEVTPLRRRNVLNALLCKLPSTPFSPISFLLVVMGHAFVTLPIYLTTLRSNQIENSLSIEYLLIILSVLSQTFP